MFLGKSPLKFNDPEYISVTFKYYVGSSWEECGISKVSGFLQVLGFRTADEIEAFCESVNTFEKFSARSWMISFLSENDARLLAKLRETNPSLWHYGASVGNFAAINIWKTVTKSNLSAHPKSPEFFLFLFTWFTTYEPGMDREKFVAWWKLLFERTYPSGKARPDSFWHLAPAAESLSAPILKSFKTLVDQFLEQYRLGKVATVAKGSGSPYVDVSHDVTKSILDLVLTESKWNYSSGNELNVGVNSAIGKLGINAGVGYYYVFDQNKNTEYFPLKFGQVSISGGLTASTPISVSLSLSKLPSLGIIYKAWSAIDSPDELSGIYCYVSPSASLVLNLNASILFFLLSSFKIPTTLKDLGTEIGKTLLRSLIGSFAVSKAVMAVNGHAIEAAIGFSGSIGYGYVDVGSPINVSK